MLIGLMLHPLRSSLLLLTLRQDRSWLACAAESLILMDLCAVCWVCRSVSILLGSDRDGLTGCWIGRIGVG